MGSVGESSHGPATILAIGTANPPFVAEQATYADYYFKVTNSEHMVDLKEKFGRMCEKSAIEKRHFCLSEDLLKENPNICSHNAPSLNARMDMMEIDIPKLGYEAAVKAIEDWGRPKTDITHLIFVNSGGASLPGADTELVRMLGLSWATKRFMLYQLGCYAGGTALRLAKDVVENNPSARILIVCSETFTTGFRGPCETHLENVVAHALFGDGAAAAIVGTYPLESLERPIVELVWAGQNLIPNTSKNIVAKLGEEGVMVTLQREIPINIGKNIVKIMEDAFKQFSISNWNSLFYVVHPGGRAILDEVEEKLGLAPEKLKASREVLSGYGNMMSACVFFIMDAMRKRSIKQGSNTIGEGLKWGVLLGCGPGVTAETIVLKCP